MLKVSLLQTPRIELDGEQASLPFKRAEALLYYLLVQRSATRQELIALLWESCDEATGLKNLRNSLYTLKKALGGDFLLSPQKSLVVVNPQWELECDYDRFTREGDFSAYQGPFLQGFAVKQSFAFDEWMGRTREKLHEQYLDRMAKQAKAARAAGDMDEATRWGVEYLREDPYDETMASFLMECWRSGKKFARAAQVYQRLKEQLSEDLGVDPQESTTMLYYEIMNQWNDAAQAPEESGRPPVPVGREEPWAVLRAAANSFSEGAVRRCSQLIVGEVGSGKSELIAHFLRWADLSALLVLNLDCLQSEENFPLALWDRVMLPLWEFAQREELPLPLPVRARLGQAFSVFREEAAGPGEDAVRALRQMDRRLEDNVLLLFSAVVRRRRVLLVLEDLQWADGESLRLLDALLRRIEAGGLMAVLTCRDDLTADARRTLEVLEADGLLHRQRLHPLSAGETVELLRRELGEEAAQRLAPRFYQETGGNLYLLTELTQAYRRNGDMDLTLQTLGNILTDRLSGLPDSALQVAGAISVFQEEVPCRVLLELVGRDDRLLTAGLEGLRRRGIIEEHQSELDVACRFTHRRIRELVYEQIPIYRREELHRQAAELLAGNELPCEGAACRRISRHFRLAKDRFRALEYRVRALELDSARSCEPFPVLVGELPAAMSPDEMEEEAQQCLRELSALRREGYDAGALARLEEMLALLRGRLALFRGDTAQGTELLGVLSGGQGERDAVLMAQACALLAASALYRQQTELAERYTATGTRHLGRQAAPARQARFQRLRSGCFSLRGEYDKCLYYLQEAAETLEKLPRSTGVLLQLAAVYCDMGRACRLRSNYAEACTYFKKALALPEGGPWPGTVWVCVHYGRTAFALEDHFKARALFGQGYELAQATGELWGKTAAAGYTAYYQGLEGDYAGAAQSLADAQTTAQRLDSPLEKGILSFVCMRLRRKLDLEQRCDSPLEPLLTYPAESYARQGIRQLSGIPDVYEAELLSQSLRDGITTQQRYRAAELYSKNKHFMSE